MVRRLGHTVHPPRTRTSRSSGQCTKCMVLSLCPHSGRDGCRWKMSVAKKVITVHLLCAQHENSSICCAGPCSKNVQLVSCGLIKLGLMMCSFFIFPSVNI